MDMDPLNWFAGVGIPVIMIACGAPLRKLARATDFRTSDWCLGMELVLAAIAAELLYGVDLTRSLLISGTTPGPVAYRLTYLLFLVVLSFPSLLAVMCWHQKWDDKDAEKRQQVFWLAGLSNLVGVVLFAAFVVFVKGTGL